MTLTSNSRIGSNLKITDSDILAKVKRYPRLPFESDKLLRLRSMLQKPLEDESCEAFYFHRRVSIYITIFLNRMWPNLTPNSVTRFGTMFSLFSSVAIALMANAWQAALWGLISYHIAYFADLIDGELARIKRQFSKNAKILDRVQDYALLALTNITILKTAVSYDALPIALVYSAVTLFRFGMFEVQNNYLQLSDRVSTSLIKECLRYPFLWSGTLLMNAVAAAIFPGIYNLILGFITGILFAHALLKFNSHIFR
ncbi:MAG: hypothetical protein GXO35_02355 [Gammaproteobacteria bacterium]|nr:hypothetical protein [Gammaproteobacteria bacterium]